MNVAIFALLVAFVAANVWTEAQAEGPNTHWWNEPLSHYLHGYRWSWLQCAAYLGFAAAEVLLIIAQPHGRTVTISLAIAAGGLVGVVATAKLQDLPDWRRNVHGACAGLAFGGALVAEWFYLRHRPDVWFVIGAIATALAFVRFAPRRTALEEKAFTLWLVAGFVAIAGLPL